MPAATANGSENAGSVPSRNAGEPLPASVVTLAFQPSGVGNGLRLSRNKIKAVEPPRITRSMRTAASLRIFRLVKEGFRLREHLFQAREIPPDVQSVHQ